MRDDSIGLFWEDLPKVRGAGSRGPRQRGPMPPIPATGWQPPTSLPNLAGAKVLGIDTETYDPHLRDAGPGWGRNSGHIIGVSLAVQDGTSWYFPLRHGIEDDKQVLPPEHAAMNMDPDVVFPWLRHVLATNVPKVGANLLYDIGWLLQEEVHVGGKLYDIQYAEALLNSETPNVSLEALAQRYLGAGKVTNELYEWLARWCGGKPTERQRQGLYLSPPCLAGPYAEADASLPIQILNSQWSAMAQRGVLDLFDMECRLTPLLVKMRMKGAPVNLERTERLHEELGGDLEDISARISHIAGREVNPAARSSLEAAFTDLGIPIPTKVDTKTKETKVSFDAPRLEAVDHPIAEALLEYRRTTKVRDTFVKAYLLDKHVNGRVHCSFHPLKNDGNGARSGRFSSSDPNLQNIPVRTEMGRRVRECFESHVGGLWRKADFSQIEYRMLAHHACGQGAVELRAAYNANPDTDYHDLTAALVEKMTGQKLPRRNIKNINFGLIYGMSQALLCSQLGLSPSEGTAMFDSYHRAAPYARATMDEASAEVHRLGYVETVLGRKSDFTMWGPKWYEPGQPDLPYGQAVEKWGIYKIERSRTHKALNRKLQGGAADVMKRSMVETYEAGLFEDDACGMPLLTVHDELDFDDQNNPDGPWWKEFKHTMEHSMPQLRVPVLIDISSGKNWGVAD